MTVGIEISLVEHWQQRNDNIQKSLELLERVRSFKDLCTMHRSRHGISDAAL